MILKVFNLDTVQSPMAMYLPFKNVLIAIFPFTYSHNVFCLHLHVFFGFVATMRLKFICTMLGLNLVGFLVGNVQLGFFPFILVLSTTPSEGPRDPLMGHELEDEKLHFILYLLIFQFQIQYFSCK